MRDHFLGYLQLITLHNTVFLSSMLLTHNLGLVYLALTYLHSRPLNFQFSTVKKILGVRKSALNAFVFLELGVLPIEQEKLGFLYQISKLNEDDPVKKRLEVMKIIPFPSRWRDVKNSADVHP